MKKTISLLLTAIIVMASMLIPVGVFAENNSIKVMFSNGNTSSSTNSIYPRFKVTNTSSNSINLADLKLRYYYTIDQEQPQKFWCDNAGITSNNTYTDVTSIVTGNFAKLAIPSANADYYLEVGFNSGTLESGASIEVQTRFAKNDWSNFNQSNDYSFCSSSVYTEGNSISAFLSGTMVFGTQIEIQNSSILPTHISFDKNASEDIVVAFSPNGNQLVSIKSGSDLVPYVISGNTVKIAKDYLSSLPIGEISFIFDFSAGTDPVLGITIMDTTPKNSSILMTSAFFDKNASNQADILVTVSLNGNKLLGITNGSDNVPYTTYGDFVKISKGYLASLPVGNTSLKFDFSAGVDPVLDISVMDTTPKNSSISITSAFFDKNTSNQADILVTVSLNGNKLLGISNGSENVPYATYGDFVKISKGYLASLPVGNTSLTFDFSSGVDPVLDISIMDTTPKNSSISITSASFDKNTSNQADILVTVSLNGNKLLGITNGSDTVPYKTDGNVVCISKEYLASLSTGKYTLTFNFNAGNKAEFILNVIDTTSQNMAVTVGSVEGKQGDMVTIPIITSSVPSYGINYCDFTLNYDTSKLELIKIEPHPYIIGYLNTQRLFNGIKFKYFSGFSTQSHIINKDDVFASVTFRIKHSAAVGNTNITIADNYKFRDTNNTFVNIILTNGIVNITNNCPFN